MLLDFLDQTVTACIAHAKHAQEERSILTMLEFEDYEHRPELKAALRPGRQRLQLWEECRRVLLREMAKKKGWRLSHEQIRFLDEMRNASLVKMYEGDWHQLTADRQWLRDVFHIRHIKTVLQVTYPRRSGKTLVQTLYAAICMLTQPNGNMFAVSPKQVQARGWLNYLYGHLNLVRDHDHFGWEEKEYRAAEVLTIVANATGARVNCTSRGNASSAQHVDSLRGGGNDLFALLIDEFYFLCDEAYTVILPMAANGCSIQMGSSMALRQAKAYEMRNSTFADGEPIVYALDHRDRCDECIRKEADLQARCSVAAQAHAVEENCPHVVRHLLFH